jgi:DNA-binding XRE family transcriptional regulator
MTRGRRAAASCRLSFSTDAQMLRFVWSRSMVVAAGARTNRARPEARSAEPGGTSTVTETISPATGLPGLREARETKLLTQQELADASGVNRSTISQLEAGTRSAHLRTIRRLAQVLDVPAQELLASARPMRRPRRRSMPTDGAIAPPQQEEPRRG